MHVEESRNIYDNPHRIDSKAWYRFQDELFDVFMGQIPQFREELKRIAAADGGLELDGSVDSLDALNAWVIDWARREPDDGATWWPMHQPRPDPSWTGLSELGTRTISPQAARMIERISVYFADVVMGLVPGSRWVCWRGSKVGERFAGSHVLDVGVPTMPIPALAKGASGWGNAYMSCFDETHFAYRPPDPGALRWQVERVLGGLESHREKGLEQVFQPAPTGPEAAGDKKPHSGRLEYHRIDRKLRRDGVA